MVHIVLRNGQLALDQIVKFELPLPVAGGTEPQDPGLSCRQGRLHVLQRPVPPDGIFSVVACCLLVGLLLLPHGGQFFLRTEAGVSLALPDQPLGVDMVNIRPLALAVGAVIAGIPVHGGPFVKVDAVVLQRVDEDLHRTGDLPLGIGVLHPQEQHAAALVGHPLGGQALDQVAQVNKARRRGGHPGDHSPFRQVPGGIFRFQLCLGHGDLWEKKVCKGIRIHKLSTSLLKVLYCTSV